MIVKTFIGINKQKAVRRAMDYWYRYFKDDCALIKFLSRCAWKKKGKDYIVIYRGPAPKDH